MSTRTLVNIPIFILLKGRVSIAIQNLISSRRVMSRELRSFLSSYSIDCNKYKGIERARETAISTDSNRRHLRLLYRTNLNNYVSDLSQ